MLFLENKVKIKKTNYTTMLFMTTQANPPKIRSILLRWLDSQVNIWKSEDFAQNLGRGGGGVT